MDFFELWPPLSDTVTFWFNRDLLIFWAFYINQDRSIFLALEMTFFKGTYLRVFFMTFFRDFFYKLAKAGLRPARPRLDCWARIQFCGVFNQKNHGNQPKTMNYHETNLKIMETNQKPWKTMKPTWKTMETKQKPRKTMIPT